jgi:oligopeptide transport system substrate-binding protein
MPTINCHLSDDANNMLANFKNGTWDLIDDVPTAEIPTLKTTYPTEFKIDGQIGTYYISWNINARILPASSDLTGVEAEKAQQEIRQAIGLLLDRNYIVNDVAQGGQLPASSFVAMGMKNPDGTEFYKTAYSTTDSFDGYYDVSEAAFEANVQKALDILAKYYK